MTEAVIAPKPFSIGRIPLWHLPVPVHRQGIGTHPSVLVGEGVDIAKIRPLEAGESRRYYSSHLSARFRKPYGVFFRREQEASLTIIIDLPRAMEFRSASCDSKRAVALRIASTLALSAVGFPNDAQVTIIALGAGVYKADALRSPEAIKGTLRRIARLRVRAQRGAILSRELRSFCAHTSEHLICIISDFLISPENQEWQRIREAMRMAKEFSHEVVFIRVIDPVEDAFSPRGSVYIHANGKRGVWAGRRTSETLNRFNLAIQRHILNAADEEYNEEGIRHLQICGENDDRISESLKTFLQRRARRISKMIAAQL
jgi:uncharacterized protein (DUF58 family)